MTGSGAAEPVRVERDGALAVLTIDDPPLNLFSRAVLDGLAAALGELTADPPRALLVTGAGDVTSGGVDVAMFEGGDGGRFAEAVEHGLERIVAPLEALPCPTVMACHGVCLTAAFELALACDLIVAGRGTQFGLVEAALGLTPAMGGTQRLAARIGEGRARELVLLGRLHGAEELLAWGAISRVVDDDRVLGSARRLAERLAAGPTRAHAATKGVLGALRAGGVAEADRRQPAIAGDVFATDDVRVGVRSFLADGPGHATFTGR